MDYHIKQMIGDEETHRYVLASRCTKPLVVIGVNPSTANEKHPDPTVRKVMGFAELNSYDGFVMLNLYSQRSTNFKGVHNKRDEILHQNNLDAIKEFFKTYNDLDVLVAWGNLLYNLKSATKPLNVLIAFARPLITEFADNLNLKHPLLPTISPYPTM